MSMDLGPEDVPLLREVSPFQRVSWLERFHCTYMSMYMRSCCPHDWTSPDQTLQQTTTTDYHTFVYSPYTYISNSEGQGFPHGETYPSLQPATGLVINWHCYIYCYLYTQTIGPSPRPTIGRWSHTTTLHHHNTFSLQYGKNMERP